MTQSRYKIHANIRYSRQASCLHVIFCERIKCTVFKSNVITACTFFEGESYGNVGECLAPFLLTILTRKHPAVLVPYSRTFRSYPPPVVWQKFGSELWRNRVGTHALLTFALYIVPSFLLPSPTRLLALHQGIESNTDTLRRGIMMLPPPFLLIERHYVDEATLA